MSSDLMQSQQLVHNQIGFGFIPSRKFLFMSLGKRWRRLLGALFFLAALSCTFILGMIVGIPIKTAPATIAPKLAEFTPPPTEEEDANQQLLRAAQSHCNGLVQGQLAYEPTKTMTEGVQTQVIARVARGKDPQILTGLSDGKKESILVTCAVKADLTAPDKSQFDIVAALPTSTPHFLNEDDAEQWTWEVTPLTHGTNLHLLLTIVPMMSNVGEVLVTKPLTIDRVIDVAASPAYEVKTLASKTWVLLGGATFLGGGIATFAKFLWEKFMARRKKSQPERSWETP